MSNYPNSAQGGNNVPEKVFSKMLRAGGKNFFFDVKKASNGSNYLTISQSYKNQNGEQVVSRVMLFKDHFQNFFASLQEASTFLK